MRTGLGVSLVLLIGVVICSLVSASLSAGVSARYVSAAEEIAVLAEMEDWQRAAETVQVYAAEWEQTEKWLQILANHEDTDALAMSLKGIAAGIRAKDVAMCLEACGEMRENAQHIRHRDAFTLGNVL